MRGERRSNHHFKLTDSPPSENESRAAVDAGGDLEPFPKEQDRLLPVANVSRIMKKTLPASAKISKEAKVTVQECVSEFISFITGEASDKCKKEKRKTINGDDLMFPARKGVELVSCGLPLVGRGALRGDMRIILGTCIYFCRTEIDPLCHLQ